MRSGSYVKAMGDAEDSGGDEGSPKPSPKSSARRQSYLKATHLSLNEQQAPPLPRRPRGYPLMQGDFLWSPLLNARSMQQLSSLPCLREQPTNRSLDNLDCLVGPLEPDPCHWNTDFKHGFGTLGRGIGAQVCGQVCGRMVPYYEGDSQAVDALDLRGATCFRSRSHSYLRAIQAGCSQDDDTASVDSDRTLPISTGCGYGSHPTVVSSRAPPVPPRSACRPLISITLQSSTESARDSHLEQRQQGSESGGSDSSDSLCSLRRGALATAPAPAPAPPAAAAFVAPLPTSIPGLALSASVTHIPSTPAPAPPQATPIPAPRDIPPAAAAAAVSTAGTTSTSTSSPTTTTTSSPTSSSTQSQNDALSCRLISEKFVPSEPKRKLSSIGIQVDCVVPVPREEGAPLNTPLRFTSIGVQVENGRPLSRDSSMASRQNTESEPQDSGDAPPAAPAKTAAASSPNGPRSAGEEETPAAARVPPPEPLGDPALDPSSLPPPHPSLGAENGSAPPGEGGERDHAAPACPRDGNWFLKLLRAETARMEGWCRQMELETKDRLLTEEVLGTVRSAVGSAQLLIASKFQQFRGLCEENLDVNAKPRPTAQDLAGFWDLLQLTVEDISLKFDELYQLKANNWQLPEKPAVKEEKKPAAPVTKKPVKPRPAGKDRSLDSAADKQRQDARKRLLAAKRAASTRQNSATESADSIEIYVPEAQTRL